MHIFGILILLKKVAQEKNVEGLSLQSQQLTAAYLGLRLVSSAAFEGNHHTFLDAVTLTCTLGVVAVMRGSLRRTYDPKLDMDASAALKYVLAPCVVLGLFVNPGVVERVPDFLRPFAALLNVMWASSVFLEAVSVVPQLVMIKVRREERPPRPRPRSPSRRPRLTDRPAVGAAARQNVSSKLGYLERNSTAHYVFSLGIARFLGCASWILQPNTLAFVFSQLGSFKLWGVASLLSELIQTFVLADFWCVDSAREDAPGEKRID